MKFYPNGILKALDHWATMSTTWDSARGFTILPHTNYFSKHEENLTYVEDFFKQFNVIIVLYNRTAVRKNRKPDILLLTY